jgi:hypothetical protein
MDVNEHERLSNITLRHKLLKEQFVVRKDMNVNEHERLSNINLDKHGNISKKGYDSHIHLHSYTFLLMILCLSKCNIGQSLMFIYIHILSY